MKLSFIATVFNEEKSIEGFLQSLISQTKMPDEIVIVDANSKDKTLEIINSYKKKFKTQFPKVEFQVFQKKGNRSVGRNFAIKKAKGEIIAVSDAGCILKKDWFKNITKSFSLKNVDVVAGFYRPKTTSVFQRCLATYTCVMEDRLDDNFLPSSRSVAFKKSAWEKIGGYPENLDTCEDLVFARDLKRAGSIFKVQKNAVVIWLQKKNIWQAFKQFFSYARGDGQALYIRNNTPFLFLRYLVGLVLIIIFFITKNNFFLLAILLLLFLYILWAINKNYRYINGLPALFFLPLLQFTADISVQLGFITGFVKHLFF